MTAATEEQVFASSVTSAREQAEAAVYDRISKLAGELDDADQLWSLACAFARMRDGYSDEKKP